MERAKGAPLQVLRQKEWEMIEDGTLLSAQTRGQGLQLPESDSFSVTTCLFYKNIPLYVQIVETFLTVVLF